MQPGSILAAIVFAALSLAAAPAAAHGGAAHASAVAGADAAPSPFVVAPAVDRADDRSERDAATIPLSHGETAVATPSPCPGDNGGLCCCRGSRGATPAKPRVGTPLAAHTRVHAPADPEPPSFAFHPIAVASAQPVGAVGARGPPDLR